MLRINKSCTYTISNKNTDEIYVITPIVIEEDSFNGIQLDMRVPKGDDFGYDTIKELKFSLEECHDLYATLYELLNK